MARFSYRAVAEDGRTIRGHAEAESEQELEKALATNGLFLLEAKLSDSLRRSRRKKITARERIDFFYQLETMLRAGVPLLTILADLRDSSESLAVAALAADLHNQIENGAPFSEALGRHPTLIEPMMRTMIQTGEATGQLPEVLREIVTALKWRDEMTAKTKKALTYPAFVTVVILGVVIFLMVYLVPQLVQFLKNMGQELPLPTRALIALSDFIIHQWYWLIIVPTAVILISSVTSRHYPPYRQWLHRTLLQLPILGPIIHKIILARFANSFALMFASGVPVIQALELTHEITSNLEVRTALEHATDRVIQGTPLSEAFAAAGLFPPLVVRMLRIGEQTGQLDDALRNVSYYYMRDVDEALEKMQSLLEPALTLILGLILGWIMIAVLGPIYDTISKIRA